MQNTLYFRQKGCAHFSTLYYVNALYVFIGSNLSLYWQFRDKVLCFEIES